MRRSLPAAFTVLEPRTEQTQPERTGHRGEGQPFTSLFGTDRTLRQLKQPGQER